MEKNRQYLRYLNPKYRRLPRKPPRKYYKERSNSGTTVPSDSSTSISVGTEALEFHIVASNVSEINRTPDIISVSEQDTTSSGSNVENQKVCINFNRNKERNLFKFIEVMTIIFL